MSDSTRAEPTLKQRDKIHEKLRQALDKELPKLKVGDRFIVPSLLPHMGRVELVRKSTKKTWLVADILPNGNLDLPAYCISTKSLVGKTVTLLPF